MVAQAVAAAFPARVAGLVSISSHTGEAGVGDPSTEALAALLGRHLTALSAKLTSHELTDDRYVPVLTIPPTTP